MNSKTHTPSLSKKSIRLWLATFFSLCGAIAGIVLTEHFYSLRGGMSSFKSYCNINSSFNCDSVALSRFSELFWGLPLSSFVTGWLLSLAIILVISQSPYWRRDGLRFSFLMSAFSVFMGLIYFLIMMVSVRAYCLVCIIVDIFTLSTLGLIVSLKPEWIRVHKIDFSKWKVFISILLVCLPVSVLSLKGLEKDTLESDMTHYILNNLFQSTPVAVDAGPEYPFIGSPQAPITIVEFSDFQCPFCKMGAIMMNNVVQRHPNEVRVVFRNFPLNSSCNRASSNPSQHPASCDAARISLCAHRQNKFKSVYEIFFEKQSLLSPQNLMDFAKEAGANVDELKQCLAQPETETALVRDTEEGIRLSLASTPTFFVNGLKIEGVLPLSAWSFIVQKMMANIKK